MRLFVIDAHPLFREGLKSLVKTTHDLTIVGECEGCEDVLQKEKWECDLVILDGELQSLTLLHRLEKIRPKGQPPFTLVLTSHSEEQHALQMLTAGADGYLSKNNQPPVVLDVMRKVSRGGKYITPEIAETMLGRFDRLNKPVRLSQREYQVLYLLSSGRGMKEIASELSLSTKTVSTYRARLLEKLNLTNNAQLMRYAMKEGLIQ